MNNTVSESFWKRNQIRCVCIFSGVHRIAQCRNTCSGVCFAHQFIYIAVTHSTHLAALHECKWPHFIFLSPKHIPTTEWINCDKRAIWFSSESAITMRMCVEISFEMNWYPKRDEWKRGTTSFWMREYKPNRMLWHVSLKHTRIRRKREREPKKNHGTDEFIGLIILNLSMPK